MSDHLQTILAETGQFGSYQRRLFAVSVLVIIIYSFRVNEYIFTTARIPTRCLIRECENQNFTQYTPAWLNRAVPLIDGNFDNCHRYAPAANANASADACPAELFDTNTTVACENYVYENRDTVAYDFGLACDEWHRTLIGSVRMGGILLGMPIVGYVSDRWGRRITLIANEITAACLGVMRYWSTSYGGYVGLSFIESAISGSQFSCIYILLIETVQPKHRGTFGTIVGMIFALALILLALIAWAVPNWRTLTLVLYAPQFIAVSYFWVVPESIRWNLSKGNYDAAEAALKKVAHMNGKVISEEALQDLRQATKKERQREVEKDKKDEPWLIVQVFRSKPILLRCAVTPLLWITMTMIYYGLSINTTNMFGSKYVNIAAVTAAEIPGCLLGIPLMNRVDRRHILAVAYWICSACQIAYIFLPKGMFVMSFIVYLIGKLCITLVGVTLYVYTSELYPTRYRHNLFSFSSMVGRIGSIVAPLTPAFAAIWAPLPFVLFASMALTAGLLVLVLPETRGTVLPDTMKQAALLGSSSRPLGAEDLGLLARRTTTQ